MWCMATSHILQVPKSLLTISKQLMSSKQQAFFSLGLRNLHSEKACLLVECRAENISFHTNQSLSHQRELSGGSHNKESACNSGDPEAQSLGREIPQGRKQQPTPVCLPGESHGWWSLAGQSPWGRRQLAMADQLTLPQSLEAVCVLLLRLLAGSSCSQFWVSKFPLIITLLLQCFIKFAITLDKVTSIYCMNSLLDLLFLSSLQRILNKADRAIL